VSPDEIRAAAETCHEPGPGYRDPVIESFPDKVSGEIGARADMRLAQQAAHVRQCHGKGAGHRYHVLVSSGTGNALPEVTGDRQRRAGVFRQWHSASRVIAPCHRHGIGQNEQPTTRCW
jgi:hypothetical protein